MMTKRTFPVPDTRDGPHLVFPIVRIVVNLVVDVLVLLVDVDGRGLRHRHRPGRGARGARPPRPLASARRTYHRARAAAARGRRERGGRRRRRGGGGGRGDRQRVPRRDLHRAAAGGGRAVFGAGGGGRDASVTPRGGNSLGRGLDFGQGGCWQTADGAAPDRVPRATLQHFCDPTRNPRRCEDGGRAS